MRRKNETAANLNHSAKRHGARAPKQSSMFLVMLGAWVLCLLYFSPRLFALLIGPEFILVKAFLMLFVFLQIVFWFYIFFHLVIIGFSYIIRCQKRDILLQKITDSPAVALLYTTCNDFQEEAARTHVSQQYQNYRLFILDDSADPDYQHRIDSFQANYADKVTVIRRKGREGFKAGNINHAMRQVPREYEYFSISDADTLLPPDYIRNLFP